MKKKNNIVDRFIEKEKILCKYEQEVVALKKESRKIGDITDKDVAEYLRLAGHNLVTCGKCGGIIYHKVPYNKETIKCPYCRELMETSDCPDLFY